MATIKVLLIEDSPTDAHLIKEHFSRAEELEFEVEIGSRLSSGLSRLNTAKFDVLLLDLSLPDSTGMETVIKARAASPGIPIVVLSGQDDENVAISAVQKGAQDYLVKSRVSSETLVRATRYAIQRHRIQASIEQARSGADTPPPIEPSAPENPYTHPPQTEGPGDGTAPVIHLPDPARLGENGLDSDAIVRVSQRLGTVLLMVGNNTVRSAVAALRLKGIADWLCQIGAQPRDVLEGYDGWLNTAAPDDFDRKNTLRIRTIGLIVELMGHLAIAYQEAEVR
ncbi:MAG: response regulator [Planctomycetota bacterium]|nr:response regulator [Planctomycetota bacterium]